jgi:hypothetical protein
VARAKQHPFLSLLDADIQWWGAGDGVPSKSDLDRLEAELGVELPAEYRQFQIRYGATMVVAKEDVWPRSRSGGASGPYWTFLYGFTILGLGEGAPDYLDIRASSAAFHAEFPGARHLVPFFAYADADFHCFDAAGRIHAWSHETPDESDPLTCGFDEFLLAETRHLVQRKDAICAARATSRRNWRTRAVYPERR